MKEALLADYPFENGVELKLYDASRRVAGDRWQVVMIARARIPVSEATTRRVDLPAVDHDQITAALGDVIAWEQKRERNFIDEKEMPAIISKMIEAFDTHTKKYVAHPDFIPKLIARRYQDELAKRRRHDMMTTENKNNNPFSESAE